MMIIFFRQTKKKNYCQNGGTTFEENTVQSPHGAGIKYNGFGPEK